MNAGGRKHSVLTLGFMWDFPKIRVPYSGVLTIRILLFSVLYWGPRPLFSEAPFGIPLSTFFPPLQSFEKLRLCAEHFQGDGLFYKEGSLAAFLGVGFSNLECLAIWGSGSLGFGAV